MITVGQERVNILKFKINKYITFYIINFIQNRKENILLR